MPCWTERTVSVELSVANRAVLLRALKAAGYTNIYEGGALEATSPTGRRLTLVDGRVELTGASVTRAQAQAEAGRITKAYAEEGVRTMAKKYGWNVKQDQRTGKFHLNKRSF